LGLVVAAADADLMYITILADGVPVVGVREVFPVIMVGIYQSLSGV
jgi:hypothetical protein